MHQRIKNLNKVILLLVLCFVSCDSKRVFDEYRTIDNGAWNTENPILFDFDISDTIAKRNLFFNLRNNNNYSFSNLFVITKMKFPDGKQVIDTLEYDMADKTGRFLGEGFTEIKESKLFYKENITFPTSGKYTVEIAQSMRKNGEVEGLQNLNGITEVGFRIEKTN